MYGPYHHQGKVGNNPFVTVFGPMGHALAGTNVTLQKSQSQTSRVFVKFAPRYRLELTLPLDEQRGPATVFLNTLPEPVNHGPDHTQHPTKASLRCAPSGNALKNRSDSLA
jgi:hypothetical protein